MSSFMYMLLKIRMYLLWLEVIKPINFNNTSVIVMNFYKVKRNLIFRYWDFHFIKKKQKNTMSTDN